MPRRRFLSQVAPVFCLLAMLAGVFESRSRSGSVPLEAVEAVLAAKQDVWGLAAMREPGGPSYEFFTTLLPPLRYVDTAFRHYPIVLSAPNAGGKARLVSNGSGLNARARSKPWFEFAVPVTFRVGSPHGVEPGVGNGLPCGITPRGEDVAVFGADLNRLEGPHLENGWLPMVRLRYEHGGVVYDQEAFAAVDPALSSNGVVFVRFALKQGTHGLVAAGFDSGAGLVEAKDSLRTTNGLVLAVFNGAWQWQPEQKTLVAKLRRGDTADLAIATQPLLANAPLPTVTKSRRTSAINPFPWFDYERQRKLSAKIWQSLVERGTRIEVPEPMVNNAWRALLVSLFTLVKGDDLNYSAGNRYERLFEAECGDAVRALLVLGFVPDARRCQLPLLDYTQEGLRFHDAAFKLQMLAHYFWITRDTNFIAATRTQWQREADYIVDGREPDTGLLPRENYCGDIATQVYSLNSSANGWRGVRDLATVLERCGDTTTASRLRDAAVSFRQAILAAVEKSERRDVQPAFIPVALFGEEKPCDRLTDTKLGSYWCLMSPYVLGSGVFGPGARQDRAIVDYLHEHGGVSMGMIRFNPHAKNTIYEIGVDDLYGLRYSIKLLELDEVERALTSFYGKLAQGLTRDTFVGAETTGLRPMDEFGRLMFRPPNSAAQAYFLWMLRYLLVQDWDLDDDGEPETLRLGFATPKRWLEDGKTIKVERAPTAFGEVSLKIQSHLTRGEVVANLALPTRNEPKQILLRIRVPDGWRVTSARAGKVDLMVDERGTVDISALKGRAIIRFKTARP